MAKRATAPSKSKTIKTPVKRKTTASKSTATKKAQIAKAASDAKALRRLHATEQFTCWLVFATAVILLGIWILNINMQIQALYDQIDQNLITQIEIGDKLNEILRSQSAKVN